VLDIVSSSTTASSYRATPADKKLCFVKEEVFGIRDGGPIIGVDHPVTVEMFAQPITGALCCFSWHIVVESPDRCSGLGGNFQTGFIQASKSSSIFSVHTFACH
jgi:hypothetical protein